MGSKQELILNHIIDMKESIGGILKHLDTLNNRIEKGENKIDINTISIVKINKERIRRDAYFMGGITVIIFITQIIFKFIL